MVAHHQGSWSAAAPSTRRPDGPAAASFKAATGSAETAGSCRHCTTDNDCGSPATRRESPAHGRSANSNATTGSVDNAATNPPMAAVTVDTPTPPPTENTVARSPGNAGSTHHRATAAASLLRNPLGSTLEATRGGGSVVWVAAGSARGAVGGAGGCG